MVYSVTTERRNHRRFVVEGDAIVTARAGKAPAKMVDVGRGGALVICQTAVAIGEVVKLRFAIQGYPLEIEMAGRVARVEPGLMGIEFPEPTAELDEFLHWQEAMFFAAMI